MTTKLKIAKPKKILLTGVFGPFGVDDEYGRKENIMELFHNQVTREQGLASFRFHHRSFGLYFLAENIDADVTVLDFPSKKRFEREVRNGYDAVGISFIAPNFVKAKEMARYIREAAPNTEIILGGHGTAIDGVEQLIENDHVVRGEGVRWLRRYVGQDPDGPFVHPALPSAERAAMFGVPVPGVCASVLAPGVGCVNGCKFCCTSHFFGLKYTSYISTGKQLFDVACSIADERGTDEFFVLDENFLKDKTRALELMDEMARQERFFRFNIFSSAEAIADFGPDNLVRLGVNYVWIGVESASEEGNYTKNKGSDPKTLVKELRDRGIIVLASGILCMEHHTQENIDLDIDFMVGLESDFVQFMLLTPMPVTALYRDHQERGILRNDLPFEEVHGQKEMGYRHPAFPGDSAARWLEAAFRRDYEVNSSSMYRVLETSFRGYQRLASMGPLDDCLTTRLKEVKERVRDWAPMAPALVRHAVNERERRRALELGRNISALLAPTVLDRLKTAGIMVLSNAWKLRLRLLGDAIQPKTIVTHYPAGARKARPVIEWAAPCKAVEEQDQCQVG